MSDGTVESFRMKLMRMFFPMSSKMFDHPKEIDPDIEILDPFERMENAIHREAESKKDFRKTSSS
jgi:hypothetical protein